MPDSKKDLNNRVTTLENELEHLQKRIFTLENQLNELSPSSTVHMTKSTLKEKPEHTKEKLTTTPRIQKEEKPVQTPKKKVHDDQLVERLLGVWLPRIFMVVLILGVLWGLKVGIDKGWISYQARIILGYISTIFIFYFGLRNFQKKQKLFGLTLMSGVIAIGILVTVAAYYLYELFSYPTAMIISLIYIVTGLVMAKKSKSESLTIFTGMAGFLLPFLIQGTTVTTWTFCLYILILFLTLFYIPISGKHRVSYYVIFFFFQLTLLAYSLFGIIPGDEMYIVLTALIQHLIFLVFYVNQAISRSVFTETTIYLNVIFMIGWIKLLDSQQEMPVYGVLALLYVLFAIYGFSRKDIKLQSIFTAIAVFTISVFIISFQTATYESKILLLLINGAIGIWIGLYFKSIRTIVISFFIYMLTGLSAIVAVDISSIFAMDHATWITFNISIIFIYYSLYSLGEKQFNIKSNLIDVSLIAGQFVGMIYILTLTNMVLDTKFALLDWSFETHISSLILLVAIFVSFFAYRWKHGIFISYIAVIEFLILGLVFLVSEVASYTTGKLTFSFNIFAELIYLVSFTLLVMMIAKEKFPGTNKLKEFTSIFIVITQFAYFIFFTKWYFGFVDIYNWGHDYVYIGHTIWMFLFAFLSISFGARFGWRVVRYLGVFLIGVCLIKLFFIDLINVSIVIRAVLFIIVGVVGLIYSRIMLSGSSSGN